MSTTGTDVVALLLHQDLFGFNARGFDVRGQLDRLALLVDSLLDKPGMEPELVVDILVSEGYSQSDVIEMLRRYQMNNRNKYK